MVAANEGEGGGGRSCQSIYPFFFITAYWSLLGTKNVKKRKKERECGWFLYRRIYTGYVPNYLSTARIMCWINNEWLSPSADIAEIRFFSMPSHHTTLKWMSWWIWFYINYLHNSHIFLRIPSIFPFPSQPSYSYHGYTFSISMPNSHHNSTAKCTRGVLASIIPWDHHRWQVQPLHSVRRTRFRHAWPAGVLKT